MRVLVTGGGGNLGRVLGPALAENGHEPVLMDHRELDTPHEFVKGDAREKEDLLRVMRGCDAVVHAAALHGIHLEKYPEDDFWSLNVTGTRNVYAAARELGVVKVLLCSTMGVYGESAEPPADGFAVVDEGLPLVPDHFYGLSKVLCEEMAAYHARRDGIRTIAYRLGMFVPETFIRYGFRLLKGGVDDRDVAQAFLLGLENDDITFDAFNVMAKVPFPPEEFGRFAHGPESLLEERFPGVSGLVEERGEDLGELAREWGFTYWSSEKAEKALGYDPRYNFPEFFEALKEGDPSHYPYAELPWWGV